MKPKIIFCFLLASFAMMPPQESPFGRPLSYYIENPSVFEENQEEGRAYYIPEKHQSLNGEWKFFWNDTPENLPPAFFEPSFNDKQWSTIQVPSNWEMQGYGDKLFRNVSAPFKANPPYVPKEYNPTGIYRRTFTIPPDWKMEQVFLRFEKVASASFVWVNGKMAGYNEGAQEPAEYNITDYLKAGKNTLTVCVLKYSDGYYLEGQDYWRLAGIFDDVWLYAAPSVRLFDWQIITDLDDTYTDAKLEIHSFIKNYKEANTASSYSLKTKLLDKGGKLVAELTSEPFKLDTDKKEIILKHDIKNPQKWTSETPDLYSLSMELLSHDGKVQDRIQTKMGFKETEIKGEVFYLNGVPLKVNAQNSHMQHPQTGHAMDEATIRKDFELLKQFNFNTVRTSHYPPVNKYLELANENGIYIIDETGDEAHATEWVSEKPEYAEMYKERARRMVLRDRNHPSVLFWSAGNESGEGENITEVIREGKKYDPTRYWMYGGNAHSHHAEDIIGPRYPTPIEMELQIGLHSDNTDRRPSFMDEYLSVAGNGGGGMDNYWKVIYTYPRIMGGAIWDYVSPGLEEKIRLLTDDSPFQTPVHLMGNAMLVKDGNSNVLDLNGHDQWVEVYRKENTEISGDQLTLTCKIYPRKLSSSCGSYITKGDYQFGLQQRDKECIEFYIYTNKRHKVCAPLPSDWEYSWHEVTGVYDGKEMCLYIDGGKIASEKVSGKIRNFPFPVNIGRNAEIHGQGTSVYICDARIDNVGIFTKAVKPGYFDPREAVLWLNFEKEQVNGTFFSYGIGARTYGSIWPDRQPQPEMWQMKKTVQPLSYRWVNAGNGLVEIWNRNHFLNANHYATHWYIEADGNILQQGELNLDIQPLERKTFQIPFTKPTVYEGCEYRLTLSTSLRNDELWACAGHEVAWEQLELPWFIASVSEPPSVKAPSYEETAEALVISGKNFQYSFDKQKGQLKSIVFEGIEMLGSPLTLNLWRAPLANELDGWNSRTGHSVNWKEGFGYYLATEMYSFGLNKLVHQPLSFKVEKNDENVQVVITDLNLMGKGETEKRDLYIEGVNSNGIYSQYEFIIYGDGKITINHTLTPEGPMPLWFPRVGISMVLDKTLNQVDWYGRGPQENYPDRKSGYKIGTYHSTVQEMYEPYLIPQDYGLRTDNRWMKITNSQGIGLNFSMSEWFNFNVYPFSTDNLTKSMYTYQLEDFDGITLNLDYATSGVGCTARGIFSEYKVLPQTMTRKITIIPVVSN